MDRETIPDKTRRHSIRKRHWLIHVLLFAVTAVTTTFAGSWYVDTQSESWLYFFLEGWLFSVPLMSILLVHEMGHYLAARRRHLEVSLPYFIPAIPPVGTFGAFIRIRSPIPSNKVLLEVGSWGPIAGSLVAIPLLVVGSYLSEVKLGAPRSDPMTVEFGSSLILELLFLLQFGTWSSQTTVIMHPTAMAAWFGLFITALNLLPLGQLDGGHVAYALFGPRPARIISFVVFGCLIPAAYLFWPGWLVFAVLSMVIGLRHPPPLDPYTPLDSKAKVLGWISIVLFLLTFIPAPITVQM